MVKILVTGGAGFIGSIVVKKLLEEGHDVIVIDNLSKGKKELVDKRAKFFEGDLVDRVFLENIFLENKFEAVMHFAAYKAAEESMKKPEKYSDNIVGLINLLNCMVKFEVKKIIYSSSAAVYGEPKYAPVDEKHPTEPLNYYGFTKLEGERIISWYSKLKGLVGISLRYFNVVGDGGLGYVDPEAKNIFPIIKEVLEGKREKLVIFGRDYETRDGTCIRDYIDVDDLVEAHISALKLEKSETINLGTGKGVSVLELVRTFEEVSGKKINWEFGERRRGDPAQLVASYEKAKELLGWEPKRGLRESVKGLINIL